MTLEVQNKDSHFWKIVEENARLLGILYGFGKQNSFCFSWKYGEENNTPALHQFRENMWFTFSDELKFIGASTITHFPIPIFASFLREDTVIKKYQMERKKIMKEYANKDFVELTLQKLTNF